YHLHVPATTALTTLSLHDALPIFGLQPPPDLDLGPIVGGEGGVPSLGGDGDLGVRLAGQGGDPEAGAGAQHHDRPIRGALQGRPDRKSTRLNSSHVKTSYAVFCLK